MRGVDRSPGVLYWRSETSSRVQRCEVVNTLISNGRAAHRGKALKAASLQHTNLARTDRARFEEIGGEVRRVVVTTGSILILQSGLGDDGKNVTSMGNGSNRISF